ncbi:MAG: family 43 glycosylhydrolase [Saprospiraceae bacterium]|nr:family 43 glycosylhydrolase [Saprospiraceae bacterium]
MKNRVGLITLCVSICISTLRGQNPIVPDKGVNDPHIHIFEGKAYLYATHDRSIESKRFAMDDWWVWSSDDLVDWRLESVLKPEETYIGKPFDQCWATDAAYRNGQYYWYFSEGNQQCGVVVGDSPTGPWKDPLGKPLLYHELTPTDEYDMSIFQEDDGEFHILFGVWDYYMAPLNDDMISLAGDPVEIVINNPIGPYGPDSTDDKPFLHKYNGKYYLSWGAFYAMSDHLYGPYDYMGTIMNTKSFAPGYKKPTWPHGPLQGRHGSFFQWHNQWYFAYCDMSQTGNRRFRDTFISYVHYKEDGEIAPIRVDGIGVGRYELQQGRIEAEDYFKAEGAVKKEVADGGFVIDHIDPGDYLVYPNIQGIGAGSELEMNIYVHRDMQIELRRKDSTGELLGFCSVEKDSSGWQVIKCQLEEVSDGVDLCVVFQGKGDQLCWVDSFTIR